MKNKWSLVVHEVAQHEANIWVGNLFANSRRPEKCSVVLSLNKQVIDTQVIRRDDWDRPFVEVDQRFYKLLNFQSLQPGKRYHVAFIRHQQTIEEGRSLEELVLAEGDFKTLPQRLGLDKNPFVVAIGSCYYDEYDGGNAGGAYAALQQQDKDPYIQPDIKFLMGDQVYLDVGLDSLSPIESEIRCQIADDYANSWQSLRHMLRQGGTWFLPDDHEYWNNYPNTSGINPYLWMITLSKRVRKIWTSASQSGGDRVQRVKPVRTFSIGKDLSFCLIDTRTQRTETHLMSEDDFNKVIAWAEGLKQPGVLVVSQPLLMKKGSDEDKNVVNYTEQYGGLLNALAGSGHDILCLAGDVHYGRVAKVKLGDNGTVLHEVISSPMSGLTGIDGRISSDTATKKGNKIRRFPAVPVEGLRPQKVTYPRNWYVAIDKVKDWFGVLRYKKTKEHFFTLAFTRTANKKVEVRVQAWQLRERNGKLPKKQFVRPHKLQLS